MHRFPIPLNALHAIEIVARTGALKPAADELGVTIGAVSQHIRRAEARLGVELFERTPQGLRPTGLLDEARPLLAGRVRSLADAMRALQRPGDAVLTLTLGSVFASRWLIRRLPHFTAAHPEIELRHRGDGQADRPGPLRHRLRHSLWRGTLARPALGAARLSRLLAGRRAGTGGRLKRVSDLGKVPVIDDQATMLSWPHWFEAAKRDAGQAQRPALLRSGAGL